MLIAKSHAYGNDFLLLSTTELSDADLTKLSRRLCDRHCGIGADGLIVYDQPSGGLPHMQLWNADGSPSEISGNGLRCLAAHLLRLRKGEAPQPSEIRIATDAGQKTLTLIAQDGSRDTFRASMGQPTALAQSTLRVGDTTVAVTTLRVGNPQCVALVDDLPDASRFARLGHGLATHPHFPAGTNVEFARIEGRQRVRILIWERGVGPTSASGTGACAAAAAAMATGRVDRDIEVTAPGGTQRVEWLDDGLYLTGWAERLFEGRFLADLTRAQE